MGIKLRQTAVGAVTQERPAPWKSAARRAALLIALSVGAIFIGAASWIRRTFGPISVDQMLMHLPGAGGAETTGAETGYISTFVWQALVLPVGIALAVFLAAIALGRRRPRDYAVPPSHSAIRRALAAGAARVRLRRWAPTALSLATLVVGAAIFVQAVSLPQYIRSLTTDLSMDDYYVSPESDGQLLALEQTSSGAPKNVVVIFLESIETSLADEELFEENMLAPVEQVTTDWASIPELEQYPGGGWTMAGIVGTECGVPLRGAGVGENDINSNEIGSEAASYLPGATCLGDVLSDAGYTNVFLGGADAQFASKENFLRSHGYDEVKDLRYWEKSGETEFGTWGLSDRALMEQAKAEVTRLHNAGQPFNLTMLTLDSHEPAHLFDYCPLTTDVEMTSVFRCSMEQVAGFVSYLEEMGYLEDTVVVLSGDHPKMLAEGGDFWNELAGKPDRTLFNRIWSPEGVNIARDRADQLSMFGTTLDLLGLGRSDGRAGVGVSVQVDSHDSSEASMLALTQERYVEMVESRSAGLYRKLWDPRSGPDIEAHG